MPHQEVWTRPKGKVDILLGANYRALQPAGGLERDGYQREGLRLSESKFGCGWVLSGTHISISSPEHQMTNNAKMLMTAVIGDDATKKLECSKDTQDNAHIPEVSLHLTRQLPTNDFFTGEDLGLRPLKSCSKCQNCSDCDFRRQIVKRLFLLAEPSRFEQTCLQH